MGHLSPCPSRMWTVSRGGSGSECQLFKLFFSVTAMHVLKQQLYACPTWVSSPQRQGLNCSQMHIHNPFCWRMTCHLYMPVWSSPVSPPSPGPEGAPAPCLLLEEDQEPLESHTQIEPKKRKGGWPKGKKRQPPRELTAPRVPTTGSLRRTEAAGSRLQGWERSPVGEEEEAELARTLGLSSLDISVLQELLLRHILTSTDHYLP
ncbi:uncharacterized protein LOC118376349 isoform X2 [Oncorhynchus keta]|uniref:uncharacterized protein LOC118376349 isoform X2 n=1 Tax=Oncorhynchus keta TaxID=8018 RepID=UPI00227C19FA|nr:uncharacterized protein LOC118376349 isoform X2 [Oncorhynchus keta]